MVKYVTICSAKCILIFLGSKMGNPLLGPQLRAQRAHSYATEICQSLVSRVFLLGTLRSVFFKKCHNYYTVSFLAISFYILVDESFYSIFAMKVAVRTE